jgi:hypothetical protein
MERVPSFSFISLVWESLLPDSARTAQSNKIILSHYYVVVTNMSSKHYLHTREPQNILWYGRLLPLSATAASPGDAGLQTGQSKSAAAAAMGGGVF